MNTRTLKIMVVLTVLGVTSLACNLLSPKSAVSRAVPTLLPEEAQQLQNDLTNKIGDAMNGIPVTIELTESQIASIINNQAANQKDAQIANVQVLLQDNQMIISGDANASGISGNVNITLDIGTDASGKPMLTISKAVLGNFPIPSSMLDPLTQAINQGMQGQAGAGFVIQSLTIADHKLTITGQKN